MARKPRTAAARKTVDPVTRILKSALHLAARDGWRRVSLAGVAAEAKVPLGTVYAHFPSKAAIVRAIIRRTDERVLAGGAAASGEAVHDRLFDVLMRRFDALAADKAGVAAIARAACSGPATALVVAPAFCGSMGWMLEAAGVSSAGLGGIVRAQGLALVYAGAFRVWLDDDSEDMSKTMAAVDRGLRRAERACAFCRPFAPRRRSGDDAAAAPS